jgi:hypothetical protein
MTNDPFSGGILGKARRIEVPGALGSAAIDGDPLPSIGDGASQQVHHGPHV